MLRNWKFHILNWAYGIYDSLPVKSTKLLIVWYYWLEDENYRRLVRAQKCTVCEHMKDDGLCPGYESPERGHLPLPKDQVCDCGFFKEDFSYAQ